MLRILIAEDNKPFRDGLRRLLEGQPNWEVVAEAADGHEAAELARLLQPDIVILDYLMPKLDGISAAQQIRETTPRAELVILTQHDAPFTARRALGAGIRGYVVKSDASRELLTAIHTVSEHHTFLSSAVARGRSSGVA